MGDLFRQYWMPVLYSREIEADGPPRRMLLLGEKLVAFRDSSGGVGMLAENCAHRGASLFFGRNEEAGLRCVYHGWKFDVAGRCVDMPNEPPESNFKDKIRHRAYPCVERGGLIWVYMGPRSEPPALPDLEFNMLPESHVAIRKNLQDCNWVQSLEGNLDSSHLSFLHTRLSADGDAQFPGGGAGGRGLFYHDKVARLEVMATDYGLMYAAGREEEPGIIYWRITQFLMPMWGMFAPVSPAECPMQWWIPLDDEHVMKWDVRWNPTRPLTAEERDRFTEGDPGGYVPETSNPLQQWRLKADLSNDYLMDRGAQRTRRFSGVPSVNLQDKAVLESMGGIVDRTREHLGTTDAMMIQVRRRLINAAKALRDGGVKPPGVDDPALYRVRSATLALPKGQPWKNAVEPYLEAFTDLPVMSIEAQVAAGRVTPTPLARSGGAAG
ncbi:MAG TPA: Rieske 2Fe-2S domain-containing protein [Chloroflexota bacterium]|nr:Rieske 2Fe-2S domain-containing protein [Chloroflexota bacterium]